MTKDKTMQLGQTRPRRRSDDGLGPNTDIGMRLRALYSSVQEEGVPDRLLDLLEQLDDVERAQAKSASSGD